MSHATDLRLGKTQNKLSFNNNPNLLRSSSLIGLKYDVGLN